MGLRHPYTDYIDALGDLPRCVGHFVANHDECLRCSWRTECSVYHAHAAHRAAKLGVDAAALIETEKAGLQKMTLVRMIADLTEEQDRISVHDERHASHWRVFRDALEEEGIGTPIHAKRQHADPGEAFTRTSYKRKQGRRVPKAYSVGIRGVTDYWVPPPRGDAMFLRYVPGVGTGLARPSIQFRCEVATLLEAYPFIERGAERWRGRLVRNGSYPRLLGATAVNVKTERLPDFARLFARLMKESHMPGAYLENGKYRVTEEAITWRRWGKFGIVTKGRK